MLTNFGTPRHNREETFQHIYMVSAVLPQSRTIERFVTLMLENLLPVLPYSVSGVDLDIIVLPVI